MRHLLFAVVVAGLLVGCGPTQSQSKRECQLEAVDLSGCNRASLSTLQAQGVWNVKVDLPSGSVPTAFRFAPEGGLLFGQALAESRVQGEDFYLATDVVQNSTTVRYALAGCEAPTPTRLVGRFRRCVNGAADLLGSFEAVRMSRRADEAEGSGLQLVSETALAQGTANHVLAAGGRAYVSAQDGGLVVYDVSNPASPSKVAGLVPSNDYWLASALKGSTLYVASIREGVIVYDVSDASGAPRRLKALSPTVEVQDVQVEGDRLYAVSPSPNAEILTYDVSNAVSPALLSRYYVEGTQPSAGDTPVSLVARGNLLYVAHFAYGVVVVDATDGRKPKLLGRYSYSNATSRAVAAGGVDNRTLVFEGGDTWGSHLRVLDASAPEGITQMAEFSLRPEVAIASMRLVGTRLYVAYNQDGLRILDVSNPREPRQVAYYNTWRETDAQRGRYFQEGLGSVSVPGDGHVYATESSRGLLIFRETAP